MLNPWDFPRQGGKVRFQGEDLHFWMRNGQGYSGGCWLDHSCHEKYPDIVSDPELSTNTNVLFAHKNGSCLGTPEWRPCVEKGGDLPACLLLLELT